MLTVQTIGRRAAALLAASAGLALPAVFATPARADVCAPNNAPSGTQAFSYTGAEDTWVVPPGVNWIWVTLLGGAGGQEDHSAPGGNGSGVRAYLRVDPGACLGIYVGEYGWGHGGWGWGHGGDHGYVYGDAAGYSGGGGGGASGIVGGWDLIVAGGGGGGGGNGAGDFDQAGRGGAGGDGGPNPATGDNGHGEYGGAGGCGGCASGVDGEHGQNTDANSGASAGGGGGGGYLGGGGGAAGTFNGGDGGGGGGGGLSYVGSGIAGVTWFSMRQSDGDGAVIIQWPATPPASAARAQAARERRDLLVTRAGTVRLPITCTRESGRCRGVAYVRATNSRRVLARGRYSVRAGREATVVARLTPAGHAALRRSMTVPARLHTAAGAKTTSDGRINLLGRRAPAATVRTSRAKATARGRVRLRVSCPKTAHTGCRGRLRLHDVRDPHSTSSPFRVRAGRTATVSVRLTPQARRALARKGRLDIQASTTTHLRTGTPTRRVHDVQVTRAG